MFTAAGIIAFYYQPAGIRNGAFHEPGHTGTDNAQISGNIRTRITELLNYGTPPPFQSCFLEDGDSFIMKTEELLEILEASPGQFDEICHQLRARVVSSCL